MRKDVSPRTISEWFEWGRVCFHKPDGVTAITAFKRVIDQDPRYCHSDGDTPYFYLGKIYEVEGRLAEAIVHYSRALAINRHDEESMIGRASCYTVSGRHREAVNDLNRLLQLPDNRRKVPRKLLLYVMAENFRRMEDWGQAAYWGQQALDADPGNREFQQLLEDIQAKTSPKMR
ncbi:MAG: tetratricopeptide repeat protein [Pseudomonadota bacterium]